MSQVLKDLVFPSVIGQLDLPKVTYQIKIIEKDTKPIYEVTGDFLIEMEELSDAFSKLKL